MYGFSHPTESNPLNPDLKIFSGYGQIGLIFILVCTLTMMMIPLPPVFLDFLLALNIMASITLLFVTITIGHGLKITVFPALLLLSTLFRLGLNLASTRLILSQGFAGHIIQTFGNFATGGSLLVGILMFFILSLIQFLVVSKGAERVAEVAARFSLDALPGKQMSIDADLRSGLIGQEEAQWQRSQLQQESKFFGSMDGAMKFIKGDVIAGIIITLINLSGGLFSGIFLKHLDLYQALKTYSTLSIGDGLVNQLPSLLISITAGLLVTRVSEIKNESSLGAEMGLQIFSHPKALIAASLLSLLIGFIPGFPAVLFLILASAMASMALYLMHCERKRNAPQPPMEAMVINAEIQMQQHWGQALPLTLEVGHSLYKIFKEDSRWMHCFSYHYPRIKLHLSHQVGILFPDLKISLNPKLKNSLRYHIKLWDIPIDQGEIQPEHCIHLGSKSKQPPDPTQVVPSLENETAHGTPIQLYPINIRSILTKQGIKTLGPEQMLLRHLAKILKKHAHDFVGIQEVHEILQRTEIQYPELVREVVPKRMSLQKLTEVVQRLVEEGIPIRDFRFILQILSNCHGTETDPVTLTEQVRMGMRRTLSHLYAREKGHLKIFTLSADIEEEIRKGIRRQGDECYLALAPDRLSWLQRSFEDTLRESVKNHTGAVVLTQLELRRYVKKVLDPHFSQVPVLSFQELDPKIQLQSLGQIHYPLEDKTILAEFS